jgi:hypothetical protein
MVPACQWTMAYTAALIMFVQNISHKKSEVCICPIIAVPYIWSKDQVTLLDKMPCSWLYWKNTVQSDNLNVTASAACTSYCKKRGFSFDQNTTHLLLALWYMAPSSLKRTFEWGWAWVIVQIHVSIWQFIHESWAIWPHFQGFLHVVSSHGTRSTDDHYHVNFIWEHWMEIVTAVLYKLKLILGAYCVGVNWLITHPTHRKVTKASTYSGIKPW